MYIFYTMIYRQYFSPFGHTFYCTYSNCTKRLNRISSDNQVSTVSLLRLPKLLEGVWKERIPFSFSL